MPIIQQLKAARVAQGRAVSEIAQTANLNPRTLYNAEATGNTTLRTLEPWAAALGFRLVLVAKDADISAS